MPEFVQSSDIRIYAFRHRKIKQTASKTQRWLKSRMTKDDKSPLAWRQIVHVGTLSQVPGSWSIKKPAKYSEHKQITINNAKIMIMVATWETHLKSVILLCQSHKLLYLFTYFVLGAATCQGTHMEVRNKTLELFLSTTWIPGKGLSH